MVRLASVLAVAVLALPASAFALDSAPEAVLARIKKDIFFLAGPECEGRGTETKGILKAGRYVADAFQNAGLDPAGTDGYFQPFTIAGPPRLGTPNALTVAGPDGKRELKFGTEFTPLGLSESKTFDAPLAFVGYGLTGKKYDDYAGVDAAGKVVIVLRRTPRADAEEKPFVPSDATLASKLATAAEKKVAGVLFVNDASYAKNGDPLMDFRYATQSVPLPVIHVKRTVVDAMLKAAGTSLQDVEAKIDADFKPQSQLLKGQSVAGVATVDRPACRPATSSPCRRGPGRSPRRPSSSGRTTTTSATARAAACSARRARGKSTTGRTTTGRAPPA